MKLNQGPVIIDCQTCEWQCEFNTIGLAELGCRNHHNETGCPIEDMLGSRCLGWE